MNNIIFVGGNEHSLVALKTIFKNKNYNLLFCISTPSLKKDRNNKIIETSVSKFCKENNIKVYEPIKYFNAQSYIEKQKVDLILVCAYGQIISKDLINKHVYLNIHFSLLPKYRGASPAVACLKNGDLETGITIQKMKYKLDTGNILFKNKIIIDKDDDLESLFVKFHTKIKETLNKNLDDFFNNNYESKIQDEFKASYTSKITNSDRFINFNDDGENVYNQIRSLSPTRKPYFKINNKLITILKCKLINNNKYTPNKIIDFNKENFLISTKKGVIKIIKCQLSGKKPLLTKDFTNGVKFIKINDTVNQ